MFCKKCGNELDGEWKVCPNCGEKIGSLAQSKAEIRTPAPVHQTMKPQPKNKKREIAKDILLIVLGIFIVALIKTAGSMVSDSLNEEMNHYEAETKDNEPIGLAYEYEVDEKELARNASKYNGKKIKLTTSFTIISGEVLAVTDNGYVPTGWPASQPVVDESGKEIGNVVMGDEGAVIGTYHMDDNDSIEATSIIVFTNENIATESTEDNIVKETLEQSAENTEQYEEASILDIPADERTQVLGKGWQHGFILPYSDCEYVTDEELEELDSDSLRIARNEIYARHGRKFNDPNLQAYFEDWGWYEGVIEPDDFDESCLNEIEKSNIDSIIAWEGR